MASWASWSCAISTKPKPRERPVNLSVRISAEATVLARSNSASSAALVALKGKFPTNNFVTNNTSKHWALNTTSTVPGARQSLEPTLSYTHQHKLIDTEHALPLTSEEEHDLPNT